ncbi:hypothetical protein HUA74_04785 [Myxococcus sp. CA051A]|uniref:Metallo-beta-lactamase domain-containing protein n=1 Tax=Myxococcus llanfairpwllgwyngyllgogerychwyrndrobwllllantysiliogogogochensis TaxID=2590453 RepID=A0A540X0R6_9BACT|nr:MULTISPECIES: hypothetical protein [Myxococcus]NTX01343.1 hypothetical protein [Myxococcus sp. CA040A]NTX15631.1 hypothetical protein [Myxococcus sp. CA056]NTX49938.1 hypothetical protein [Myxococcus sp. CA039A]NTX59970.1 hypothetical protein [Myxococcus sp. CA051A]TQF14800.1 hypothetical protein FJV41_16785 [Myxococcus llanfairpwllgwyngyllgogerychwyrndrobwllllantysiliogogogochensis]
MSQSPAFRPLPFLAEAHSEPLPGLRLQRLRRAALEARERFVQEGPVAAVATCELVTFPYPAQFAFSGAALSPAPYVMMTNRMQVVQFVDAKGERRTLLFNPSDYERGVAAPFYHALRERYGGFVSDKLMSTRHGTVQSHLASLGLTPADVDYLAFDHLHIQDLRGWLGGDGVSAYFPRAKLLVQRAEWEMVKDLHPMQTVWFVPGGADIPAERVVLLDGDTWLGVGAAILSTPGHTRGNMSLAVATSREVFVVSENGVATESYTPLLSAIPGVRRFAEHMGWEVVLNGNTREDSLSQYSSMVVEKLFAGHSAVEGAFINFHPSSLLTSHLLSPGLAPTIVLPAPNFGDVRPTPASRRAA